ncbi:MAG: hemerythrin domain-containing protein [Aquincola sp.]|nr:hemerythrin domain-containing protein [Aquincola sp.]MDH4287425.1 hemerythrin domain-containing protein [Aquincola sp.]MDH5328383.1 hemerythrin domain-containing protein [Aquincola sp.]
MPLPLAHEFDALDQTHADVLQHLRQLEALINRLESIGADDSARDTARVIRDFFDRNARHHHAEEERVVFPPLLASGNAELVQHVQRLQQDHGWLEEDWHELQPQLDAIANGMGTIEPELIREAVTVFGALYLEHIALEESLIYPEAKRRMEAQAAGERGRSNGSS